MFEFRIYRKSVFKNKIRLATFKIPRLGFVAWVRMYFTLKQSDTLSH